MSNTPKRALAAFTGGISNGEYGLGPEDIVVMERGQGCHLWDTTGREYLDFSMAWGSCLVGHARPEVVEAVTRQAPLGSNFAFLNAQVLELAEEIQSVSPAAERLRFCASGTEATMYCQRVARGYTGRRKILKFEGAYHGANETGVTSLFPNKMLDFPTPELTSAGTPHVADLLLVAPYNDLATTRAIIDEHKDDIAAVIMEPLQRCTPPLEGFLEGVRALCTDNDILLIFDEVVTGFRLAYGGAQEYYGVIPDLIAYGKAMGGGYPIGAFGGRADIMEMVNEQRIGGNDYVWMASTLGGNPVSCAAALAALSVYRQPATYERLHAMGRMLRSGMADILEKRQITGQIIGDGPLAQVVFTDQPAINYRGTCKGDKQRGRATMLALLRKGVFLNPMGTKLYLSIAHDEAVIGEFLGRFDEALGEATGSV
ncbi:MAG: aspartate aminotransferase family protein [Rhodospirillaceae bacterium]|nr:aspartate aminotransferase family protein [Rhodospirillaceae bacterium]